MDEVANQLRIRLSDNPTDWACRLELAERYFSHDAHEEIADLFREASTPPDTQDQMHRAVELTAGSDLSGLTAALAKYASVNSLNAWAHHVYARILAHQHQLDKAREEYKLALSLDDSKRDEQLEELLAHHNISKERELKPDPESPPVEFEGKTFMVSVGEAIKPKEKESDTKEKKRALIASVVTHVFMLISFYFVVTFEAPEPPPLFEANAVYSVDEDSLSKQRVEKTTSEVLESADTRTEVSMESLDLISAPAFSPNIANPDPVGLGGYGGRSMSFSKGGGGGTVSFFGSKSRARRVVFVVDFSASMIGEKEKLMRQELARSVKELPNSVEYALIFFSGPAWYAGQKVGEAHLMGKFVGNVVTDGSNRYVWYEGWDEEERHSGSGKTALHHYSQGRDRLPRGKFMRASDINKRNTLRIIEETPLVFGTDWRWPLMMAMNMQPDVIYFMTDGAFGVGRGVTKKEMIDNLLTYNRKLGNAKINTVCMQVLTARNELEQLAHGSGGEFTLIKSGGTVVRGADLD